MRTLKIAVFISGNGSNLQALIDACSADDFPAEIVMVLSNRPDAFGLQRAKDAGIPAITVDHKDFDTRSAFEDAMQKQLENYSIDLICLAGFMRLLEASFVNKWRDRMINIHPSLLPSYKGLNTYARAIDDGVKFAGCTIHYVRPEMDNGPIVMQAVVPIDQDDTPETLAAKIRIQEHIMYPRAVKVIAEGRTRISGNKVTFKDTEFHTSALISP